MSINSILDIGRWAIFAAQASIETIGNNIANVNTPGYSRRKVILEEAPSINFSPGQLGRGVRAKEVIRVFNDFIEEQYLDKLTNQKRWNSLYENLKSIETLFKESDSSGLNNILAEFWKKWQDLAQDPENKSLRTSLIGEAKNLINIIHTANNDLVNFQLKMDDFIQQDVEEVNSLIKQIATINRRITADYIPGKNNPNQLFDERNRLLRKLAEKIDINVIDNGGGDLIVTTKSGFTLVDGIETYEIKFEGPQAFANLTVDSNFDGTIKFSGSAPYEYTLQVVQAGDVGGAIPALLKISIDGGRTWLRDENGNLITIEAQTYDNRVTLPKSNIEVWFEGATQPLSQGDTFYIVPKKGLYWYETSASKVNVTPLILSNGEQDLRRITGGTLAGEFNFRDYYLGAIKDKLDEFSRILAWEVNRIHSQGVGLEKRTYLLGTTKVKNTQRPLGDYSSGLPYNDKLTSGNIAFYIYDKNTDQLVQGPVYLDFDNTTAGIQNFDPSQHSLEDVVNAINNSIPHVSASIVNNKLEISVDDGYSIGFGEDTTGLLAALGINSFFEGSNSSDINISPDVNTNLNFINTAKIDSTGNVSLGDNYIANEIASLQYTKVYFSTYQEGTVHTTIQDYYNSLVAKIGTFTKDSKYNYDYFTALAEDLDERQKSISGVNLDEEMGNLIKFQQAYIAAAKLIITSEQLAQTILSMKS